MLHLLQLWLQTLLVILLLPFVLLAQRILRVLLLLVAFGWHYGFVLLIAA